jgi:histidine ammonia-lyase
MGTNAALKLSEIVENLDTLVAMETLLASQGSGFLKAEVSHKVEEFIKQYRKVVPALGEDRPPYADIEKTKAFLSGYPTSFISLERGVERKS